DQVTGVVSDRDVRLILGLSAAEKLQVQAVDIMSPDPIEVPADTPLDDVAFLMADRKVGSVLVTDEAGRLIGIFTITDALNALVDFVRKGYQGAR
ncbi:MAG TPA: CBS domain-containing protein, partial [Burkholderiaceae bacterium]|nr:CBS domain-containing protein [Burkholderiaceae bacterium]